MPEHTFVFERMAAGPITKTEFVETRKAPCAEEVGEHVLQYYVTACTLEAAMVRLLDALNVSLTEVRYHRHTEVSTS